MKTIKVLVVLTICSLQFMASIPARAADLTLVKDFVSTCDDEDNREICTAYIEGYRNGFILGLGWGKNEFDKNNEYENTPLKFHSEFCVEKYHTNEEVLASALSYFDYHSDVSDNKTPIALGIALRAKYPCPKQ